MNNTISVAAIPDSLNTTMQVFGDEAVLALSAGVSTNVKRNAWVSLSTGGSQINFDRLTSKQSRRDEFKQQFQYHNLSIEKKTNVSFYKNFPSYSIVNSGMSSKQIISKQHIQDLIGKDTPGVGTYSNQLH